MKFQRILDKYVLKCAAHKGVAKQVVELDTPKEKLSATLCEDCAAEIQSEIIVKLHHART